VAEQRATELRDGAGPVVLVALCGAADRPIDALGGQTPLEASHTPNLDELAAQGSSTCVEIIGPGLPAESDSGGMSLLGYDPRDHYTGRGPLEAYGMGFWDVEGSSVAFRINFASWDPDSGRLDRRTARDLTDGELEILVREVRAGVHLAAGVTTNVTGFARHRGILSFTSGEQPLSGRVTNTDPGFDAHGPFGVPVAAPQHAPRRCSATVDDLAAVETAKLVNEFVDQSAEILERSEVNRIRRAQGSLPANLLLVRDAGDSLPRLRPFPARTGRTLAVYGHIPAERALAELAGGRFVDASPGSRATGDYYADLVTQLVADPAGVVFVRVKGTDEPSHDNRPDAKVQALEAIDSELIGPLRAMLDDASTLIVTCDHATPCELGIHSDDLVPATVAGPGIPSDAVVSFGERACAAGELPVDHASSLLDSALVLQAAAWR